MVKHLLKVSIVLALSFLGILKTSAQNANTYGFQAVSGTFDELLTGTAFTAVQADDILVTTPINIGFNFNFCGTVYTTIRAGSNGIMSFVASAANSGYNDVSSFNTIKPALLWLWDDLDGATGTATYATIGTAPNRIFVFQYKNWEWNWSATGPNISVQVRLYETTNVVEYHYRQETQPGNPSGSSGASIGIVDQNATATYLSLNNPSATPTASPTTFTTSIAAKPANGQIYRFVPPAPCNAATVYPSSATINFAKDTLCIGKNTTADFVPSAPMPVVVGLTYQLQSGTSATGPWTNVGTAVANPTQILITPTATTFYRILVLCSGTATTFATAGKQLVVVNPQGVTGTNVTRCGPGNVTLTASGSNQLWYTSMTANYPSYTGNNVSVYAPSSTTYFVTSGTTPSLETIPFGNGANINSTSATTPFFGAWGGYKHEYLITQAELATWGISPGSEIHGLGVQVRSGGATYNGFQISIGTTAATALTTTFQTGAAIVRPATNQTVVVGQNMFDFATPYTYTGGNLLIQTCWSNGTTSNPYSYVIDDNTSFASTHYYYGDNVPPATVCGYTSGGSTLSIRPKFFFKVLTKCEATRVPVTVTVNNSPDITTSRDSVICNNSINEFTVTSLLSNYSTYEWAHVGPGSGALFTNAAASNSYTGGSRTNIYFRSSVPGTHRVVVNGSNPVSGCTTSDTFAIFVQPTNDTFEITGDKDTLCLSGVSSINVNNAALLKSGFYSWFESNNGTAYTALANPTLPFNTTNLTSSKYYRITLRNSRNQQCDTINKTIYVSHPSVISSRDTGRCDAGSVTLSAAGNPGETILWYQNATGGLPLATGNSFTTPYLSNTTTFYASSLSFGSQGNATVGNGTNTTGGYYSPFYHLYGGHKNQFLILASDLIAAGVPSGANLTSIALDAISGGMTYNDFTIHMGTTTLATLPPTVMQTGLTQVTTTQNYPVNMGWNTINLTAPFPWDGVSNVIVQTCYNNNNYGGTSTAVRYRSTSYVGTVYQRQDAVATAAICGNNVGYGSYNTVPNFVFGFDSKCESNRVPVVANISPRPVVDLGPDIDKCVDPGHLEFLNARNPGLNYVWDNNYNGQVRVVNQSGTYWVNVDNGLGCGSSDTIHVNYKLNPVTNLGNDTSVCIGATISLDAGSGGIQYYWNTGATTRTITTNQPGTYVALVTAANGCIKSDSIVINHIGQAPRHSGIRVRNISSNSFNFSLVNPQSIASVTWNFGDGTPVSYLMAPTHSYALSGNYVVRVISNSHCGSINDTTSIHIKGFTDLNDLNGNVGIKVYPNPTSEYVNVELDHQDVIKQITIVTTTGRTLETIADINNKSVRVDTRNLVSGMYYLIVETPEGTYKKKLDVIK